MVKIYKDYYCKSDSYCLILAKKTIDKKNNKEIYKNVSYHNSIEDLIYNIALDEIFGEDFDTIEEFDKRVDNAIKVLKMRRKKIIEDLIQDFIKFKSENKKGRGRRN